MRALEFAGRIVVPHIYEMFFENTMQAFLGDKEEQIAGSVHCEKQRKELYRKVIKKIILEIQDIDTLTKHKKLLNMWSECALDELSKHKYNETAFSLCLLRLIGALLGLSGYRPPYKLVTPVYFQSPSQHYTEAVIAGGEEIDNYYDNNDTTSIKKQIINQLKLDGLTDFKISLVLNVSEYQVKKLKKDL